LILAALSEISGEGSWKEKNYTFYWRRCEPGCPRQYGVGFAVRNFINRRCSPAIAGINERIAQLKMKYCGRPINLISTYALTLSAKDIAEEVFYNELEKVISAIPEHHNLAVLRDHIAWSGVIGKHGIGNIN